MSRQGQGHRLKALSPNTIHPRPWSNLLQPRVGRFHGSQESLWALSAASEGTSCLSLLPGTAPAPAPWLGRVCGKEPSIPPGLGALPPGLRRGTRSGRANYSGKVSENPA